MENKAYIDLSWTASSQEDWHAAEEYALKRLELKREIHQLDAFAEGLVELH